LKNIRGPLAAFAVALLLLVAVIATRPPESPAPTPAVTRVTATPRASATPGIIEITITAAPTISIQTIDTSILTEGLVGAPLKINPLLAGFNRVDRDLSALIFEGLMTTDSFGAAIPDLAEKAPRVSSDGLTYLVTLRQDVQWQDGTPFTADDVLFTMRLMQDDAFPGLPALRAFWRTVEIDRIDDYTIRFTLAQPLAAFNDYLRIGILPEHVLAGTSAAGLAAHPFNLNPIGTGAYQFDGWIGDTTGQIAGARLRLAATYRSRPEGKEGFAFTRLNFRFYPDLNAALVAFQKGEVFSIGEIPPEIVDQISVISQLDIINVYKPAFGAIIYNWNNANTPFFRDIHLRQALARGVDRQDVVSRTMARRAVLADSPILPNSWAYDRSVTCSALNPYSPDEAKKELARIQIVPPEPVQEAATQDPSAPTPAPTRTPDPRTPRPTTAPINPASIRFTLLIRDDPTQINLAQAVIEYWTKLGLTVQPIVVDVAGYNSRLISGEFEAALVELNLAPSSDPDPYSLWRQVPADGGLNFGGMNDRILSELTEAARRESANGAYRAELYRQFQRAFCERVPALLLYDPVFTYGIDARIEGVQLGFMADLSDRFRTIRDWKFKTP
jgi:peptide/nickel transport system substrate-binding protein